MGRLFAFPVSEIIRPLRGSAGGVGKKKKGDIVVLLSLAPAGYSISPHPGCLHTADSGHLS